VFHIHLPPLRERKEDIQSIAEALLGDLNRKHDCRVADISPSVIEALQRHQWPGNVRELRNVLERAVILAGEGSIEMNHLPTFLQTRGTSAPTAPAAAAAAPPPPAAGGSSTPPSAATAPAAAAAAPPAAPPDDGDTIRFQVGTTVEEAEKGLILRTLEHTKNNKTRAAEILGISLKTLHNKLKEYGAGREFGVGIG
jgi:DNA-binding NtrC family response regulator